MTENSISITISATTYPELSEKVRAMADALCSFDGPRSAPAPLGHAPAQTPMQAPVAAAAQVAPAPAPVAPAPAPAPVAPAPTAAPAYTQEQLATAATPLIDAGRQAELSGLLANFGVQALTQLPKEHYGAFATALRSMGARI